MTDKATDVTVTQADRDMAWPHRPDCYRHLDQQETRQNWDAGVYDHVPVIQAFARHRTASEQPASGEVMDRIATAICRTVAEIPDRSSPDDFPDAMLVTADELHTIVTCALETEAEFAALSTTSEAPEAGRLREAVSGDAGEGPADAGPFEREGRYIVIKRKHLTPYQASRLKSIMALTGIGETSAVVVEADWPEYETVWQMIEQRAAGDAK